MVIVMDTIVDSIKDSQLQLELEKAKLLGFVQNDVKFRNEVVIVKDIIGSAVFTDDIIIAYSEIDNFVNIYQGIYTSNRIIGIREVRLYGGDIDLELKGANGANFLQLDSAVKIARARKYMQTKEVKDIELVFFASVVKC